MANQFNVKRIGVPVSPKNSERLEREAEEDLNIIRRREWRTERLNNGIAFNKIK